jgi:hypothetical protein
MQRIHGPYRLVYFRMDATKQVRIVERYTGRQITVTQEAWRYQLRKHGGILEAADALLDSHQPDGRP